MRWLAILFLTSVWANAEIVTLVARPASGYWTNLVYICSYDESSNPIFCTNTYYMGTQPTNRVSVSTAQLIEILYNSCEYAHIWPNAVYPGTPYPEWVYGLHGNSVQPWSYDGVQYFPRDAYGHIYPLTLAGPLDIDFIGSGMVTYKLIPKEQPIQPGTGVVIPSDATGPVEIILESSADLVNWTAAVPGIYGANTTNRFFRVRAVRQ